ncbi:DUF6193 family natural product biosynthesis protein [Streptosporangium sp. OZ121]|uniref:DUF6193 family natural product biosynthesis protein n=1 Tax=Streptosporangium sp. OZ121 TaxID=3444183 RepID=UPI003F7AF5C4
MSRTGRTTSCRWRRSTSGGGIDRLRPRNGSNQNAIPDLLERAADPIRSDVHFRLPFSPPTMAATARCTGRRIESPRETGDYTLREGRNSAVLHHVTTAAEAIAIAIDRIPADLLQTPSESPAQDS